MVIASLEGAFEVMRTGFVEAVPSLFITIPWVPLVPTDLPHMAIRPEPESIFTPGKTSICAVPQSVAGPCAPAKNTSPPPERSETPEFRSIPELFHPLSFVPTA
jgi:hypothetical protein